MKNKRRRQYENSINYQFFHTRTYLLVNLCKYPSSCPSFNKIKENYYFTVTGIRDQFQKSAKLAQLVQL